MLTQEKERTDWPIDLLRTPSTGTRSSLPRWHDEVTPLGGRRGYQGAAPSTGGSAEIDRCVGVERMELGNLVIEHSVLLVLDDDALRALHCGGILGQDLLARLAIVFDMDRRALHLLPPSTDRAGIQAYLQETQLGLGRWTLERTEFVASDPTKVCLRLNGEGLDGAELAIDTGADTTSFPERVITALKIPETKGGSGTATGIGGTVQTQAFRFDITLGDFEVNTIIHPITLDYGLLGMDVLGKFVFVLDGPGRTLWLHRRAVKPDTDAGGEDRWDEKAGLPARSCLRRLSGSRGMLTNPKPQGSRP